VLKQKIGGTGGAGYYFPYVCFSCMKSFKRAHVPSLPDKVCPDCGGVTVGLSRNFKAPPTTSRAEWKVVEYLVGAGFRFQHIQDPSTGERIHDPYPRTMRAAKEFVRKHVVRVA
jgi:hypothetical protein